MFPLDDKVLEKTLLVGNVNPLISAEQVHPFCLCWRLQHLVWCCICCTYNRACVSGQPLHPSRAMCMGLLVCSLLGHSLWIVVAWRPPIVTSLL